jgi:cell division protein FtsB
LNPKKKKIPDATWGKKLMQKLRAENEKLKAENRALTRVVSKLTSGSLQFPPPSPSPGSPDAQMKPPQYPVPQSP